jgi:hypothetical protein
MRTIEVEMFNGKVACPYSPADCVDVETCYRCKRLRAFRDDESGTKLICARPMRFRRALSRANNHLSAPAR